jgi:fatty-acyl-CoA synthase
MPADSERTFAHTLAAHHADRRTQPALTLLMGAGQPDIALTYGDLIDGAMRFSIQLAAAGVGQGQVVVIILPHGEALVRAFWGAILHGAIPSILPPLSEKLSPDKYQRDLAALIGVTRPGAIMTDEAFEASARAAAEGRCAIMINRAAPPLAARFDLLPGMRAAADDIALLQHSSGTTGLQKGVALSHRAVFNQIDAYRAAIGLNARDVIVSWLPLYHDMGLIASFVMPVLCGVHSVIMSPFDWVRAPARLPRALATYGGTLSWLPNFAFNFMATRVRERDLEGISLTGVRALINCSEPCYRQSHQVFLDKYAKYGLAAGTLQTCYAMAENTFAVTQSRLGHPAHAPDGELHLSSGVALPNVELRVIDAGGSALPDGVAGEILVRSDCMLSGYYQRPELNAQAFVDGFYRTGDLGYVSAGELFVTGRQKDLIIVGGKNIHPNDIEQLASEVPGVHPGRVAAFGVFDPDVGTEEIIIVAESEAQGDDAHYALGDAIRAQIATNTDAVVRRVQIVPARWLIKTSSGKVSRSANRDKYLAQRV